MAKLPGFMFYPGDWRKDPNLCRATRSEKGLLMDLLCLMFESEQRGVLATCGIPWSDEEIAYAVGGPQEVTMFELTELLRKGIVCRRKRDGALFSRRMVRDEEIRAIRQKVGRLGGNPNLVNQKSTKAQPKVNQNTEYENERVLKKEKGGVGEKENGKAEGFQMFWCDYPKKVGKGEAFRSWQRINPTQDQLTEILAAVGNQKKSKQWTKEEGKYIPNPATWLNQERWGDELEPTEPKKLTWQEEERLRKQNDPTRRY